MPEKLVAIGHITNDVTPKEHLGGGVSYAAVTASRLGMEAHIITKCAPNHPYIGELDSLGIKVHLLSSALNTITTFHNVYDSKGNRRQRVVEAQEQISGDNLYSVPNTLLDGAIVLAVPVINEVSMDLLGKLHSASSINIIPQGCFRRIGEGGVVQQQRWEGFGELIQNATIVLSEEDITIDGEVDYALLDKIISSALLVAVTKGPDGVTIYQKGQEPILTGAFPLKEHEIVDYTGAGDVFATVFISEATRSGGNLKAAAVAACYFAAIKIMGLNGIGIDSIPTLQQLRDFAETNPERVASYLQQEDVNRISIL